MRKNSKNKFKSSGEKNDEMEGKQSPRISSEDSKPARFPLGRLSAKTEKFLQHNVRYLNACSDEAKRISNSHTRWAGLLIFQLLKQKFPTSIVWLINEFYL